MEEYRDAGLELGWLIVPKLKQVEVYTSSDIQALISPAVSADPHLPGFQLDLSEIWNEPF